VNREQSPQPRRLRRTVQLSVRRCLRWLAWVGVAGGVALLLVLWGWRYGYNSLPRGHDGPWETNRLFWAGTPDQTNSFWHGLRATAAQMPLHPHFRSGRYPGDPPEEELLQEWHRAAQTALRTVLAASDLRPPAVLQQQDAGALRMLQVSLGSVPSARQPDMDLPARLQRQLDAWRLHAALVPAAEFPFFFDERGVRQVYDELAKPTQELILRSGRLDPERGRAWLEEFASITNRLGPVEDAFLRQVVRDGDFQRSQWVPAWSGVRRSFQMALTLIAQDAGRLVGDLMARIASRRQGGEPNYSGAAHLVRPLEQLVLGLQTWMARPEDFEAALAGSISLTVAALRSGSLPPRASRPAWVPGNASVRPWWRRAFDRPAVWRSLESLPDPYTLQAGQLFWRQYLESCRLTLALRLFHDQRGAWPQRLEELVPDPLASLPPDPVADRPFRYILDGSRWRLLAADGAVLAEAGAEVP